MKTILEHAEKIYTPEQQSNIEEVARTYDLYDFIAAIICERNAFDLNEIKEYIVGTNRPKHFDKLKDIHLAVQIISEAMARNEKIRVVGDYDVDGVTSTYVLLSVFEALNYPHMDHYLPVRETDGYGLNPSIVDAAYRAGVKLIITVDNGISATESVSHAKSLGMQVIVTDHHELPAILPEADATINPHQPDCEYPYKSLAGVGIAYKLGQALLSHFKVKPSREIIARIQSLVAMGTVCDVAPLVGENRHMVKTGISALNQNAIPAATVINSRISVGTLGFQIGPRLNACGRLESAETALQYLMKKDYDDLVLGKKNLDDLNKRRQDEEMDSIARVDEKVAQISDLPDIIIQIDEMAHESVVGLVAGKIKEKYYRPTVVFARTINGTYKGSGRSIEEYDMFQSFKPFLHLLDGGGGHPMACGLKATTIDQIEAFAKAVNEASTLTDYDKTPKVFVDKVIEDAFAYDFIKLETQLRYFLPCGAGNAAPTLLVKNSKVAINTKYAKSWRISEVVATFGHKSISSTLWNDESIPEEGTFISDITLQVSESGWQIKNIYFR
ncbi:single-stranded-DNA-specific exonuclease RecJ [Cellulosilyticum ruminicola]|uniref:single-stranded-DNA-specific exonuclease RecJ n=1 Tax=Cellulosilyticum ruminicola TaxID=425254 RepID=UPI0006D0EE16|nr:single-stranded-DNA-specific exonuclease RecJ [Cellulosilyticum ruminicola]